MKRLLIPIIFFVAAVSLSQFLLPPSEAATFYVALTGSDTAGSGSSSNPWRTIDHAVTHVPDGSTILVRSGIYNGRVNLRGNFTQGVVVRSETPYFAALRNNDRVVTIYEGHGITLEVRENYAGGARQGNMLISGFNLIVIQEGGLAGPCNTTLSPSFVTFPAISGIGGTMAGDINVFVDESCAWEAHSDASWILISNPIGIGRSTVSYGVEPNTTGQARKGTITVNGRVVTIKQRR